MLMKFIPFVFIAAFFAGCTIDKADSYEKVESRSGYSIHVLSSMEPSTDLNSEASIQFLDQNKQLFMIVLDENKDEMNNAVESNEALSEKYSADFKGYSTFLLDNFANSMEVKSGTKIKDTVIHDLPAKTINLVSEIDGVDIFYALAFIEGVDKYYQVWTWTYAHLEEDHYPRMKEILFSLKEQ
jgi:hypothetical protein